MERPDLPEERRKLPREVFRDLKSAARDGTVEDVSAAFSGAGAALEEGDTATAIHYLQWAKSVAARSAMIREALAVAHYTAGDFDAARAELQAYRRLTGRFDQNHLLADCVRAQGRPEMVETYVEEMLRAHVAPELVSEGLLVLAGTRADAGDLEGALAALDRVDLDSVILGEAHLRRWYVEADLRERLGQRGEARELWERIAEVDDAYLDVAERLA